MDPEIVARAVAGDKVAIEKILRSRQTQLLAKARQQMSASLLAQVQLEDIFQEFYISVVKSFHTFRQCDDDVAASLVKWLNTVLLNTIRRMARRKRSQGLRRLDEEISDPEPANDPTPSRNVRRRERLVALARAIEALPPDLRQALELYYIQQLSVREVAIIVGVPESRIHGRLGRARKRLLESLGSASPFFSSR